jgi:hypothetical protein
MMFLLRTAFWIGVVLALLPTFGPKQSAPQAAGVGATEAVTAASATFADMIQFCNRQPDACAAGAQFASAFGQRAQAGAKMLYEIVGEKLAKPDGGADADAPTGDVKLSQSTLTSADLALPWRGPHRKDKGSL